MPPDDNVLKTWITTNPTFGRSNLYDYFQKCLDEENIVFRNQYLQWPMKDKDKKDKSEIPYVTPQVLTQWVAFDESSEVNNKTKNTEDKEEMNMTQTVKGNDFEVGNVILKKDNLKDPFNSEVLMLCPGLTENDFLVSVTDKGVAVTLIDECPDCGDLTGKTWYFDFNQYFEVEDVICEVKDGILIVAALYCLSNLEINKRQGNEVDTTLRAVKPNNEKE